MVSPSVRHQLLPHRQLWAPESEDGDAAAAPAAAGPWHSKEEVEQQVLSRGLGSARDARGRLPLHAALAAHAPDEVQPFASASTSSSHILLHILERIFVLSPSSRRIYLPKSKCGGLLLPSGAGRVGRVY